MTYSVIQTVTNTSLLSATASATITASLAGDLIVAIFPNNSLLTPISVTDNQSNTYSFHNGVLQNNLIAYLPNCPAGITSITATFSSPFVDTVILVREYSGVASASPLDQSAFDVIASGATNYDSTSSGVTTEPSELVIGVAVQYNGASSAPTFTAGAGYSNLSQQLINSGGTFMALAIEDKLVTSTGIQDATFTASSSPGQTDSAECDVLTFILAGQIGYNDPLLFGMTF